MLTLTCSISASALNQIRDGLNLPRAPSSGGVGNQPLHLRKVGGLRGYGDEHHVGTVVVRLRKGVHDRSCMGHRNHGEEVGP